MTLPLSDYYVQIATPTLDNKFGGAYIDSILNTKTTLEHFGAGFGWVKYPGCSDLCHARNKILDMFIKHEKSTHLLKIDADMGWDCNDVIRLLLAKRDFIAGIGPKRKLPLEYCVGNFSDKTGKLEPCAFKKNGEDIVGYPNAVGAGFVMISKLCAIRMIHAYPELKYKDRFDNEIVTGVYDPVHIKLEDGAVHREFDDYAFCYRWRKIGGVVAVFPDITLKHEGSYTFEGRWLDDEDTKKSLTGMFNEAPPQA